MQSAALAAGIALAFAISTGCSRSESGGEETGVKDTLSEADLAIRGLMLQMDSVTAVSIAGTPDSLEVLDKPFHYPYIGFSVWNYRDMKLSFDLQNKLRWIEVRRPGVMTARGLQVGDSLSRVRKLYGRSQDDYDLPYEGLRYPFSEHDPRGIVVQIDNNVVVSIYVVSQFF